MQGTKEQGLPVLPIYCKKREQPGQKPGLIGQPKEDQPVSQPGSTGPPIGTIRPTHREQPAIRDQPAKKPGPTGQPTGPNMPTNRYQPANQP